MKKMITAALSGAAVLLMPLAYGHHSYAMYDTTKRVTTEGVVAKVEWTNPHIFIWFYAPKDGGGYDLVALEGGGPAELARRGWSKDTLKVGEHVTFEYMPLRDGRNGGNFIKATHADGSVSQGDAGAPGGTPGGAEGMGAAP
jgi:hypothetical protein